MHYSEYVSTPTPFNNILWNITAKDTNGFWVGYYSHFDKSKDIQYSFIPRNDSLAGDLIGNPLVRKLIRFSRGYYCFTRENGKLHYNDLRYALAGEFIPEGRRFVFSFTLQRNDYQPFGLVIDRSAWRWQRFSGFSKLVQRIKGH